MNPKLLHRYPAISDLKHRAKRRLPHFSWEYLDSGTGTEHCLSRNESALQQITLLPEFMKGDKRASLETELFGIKYATPFGIAPVGLTGLMWPGIEKMLAKTAANHGIPYCLSTVATETPETIGHPFKVNANARNVRVLQCLQNAILKPILVLPCLQPGRSVQYATAFPGFAPWRNTSMLRT